MTYGGSWQKRYIQPPLCHLLLVRQLSPLVGDSRLCSEPGTPLLLRQTQLSKKKPQAYDQNS